MYRTIVNSIWGGNRLRTPPSIVWMSATLVALEMALPLVYLFLRTLGAGDETWQLLFRWRTLAIIVRSLILVVAVTNSYIAISLQVYWITTRTDLPLKRIWFIVCL